MPDFMHKLFRTRRPPRVPTVPPGQRVYAIGDVHGRLDLFDALATAIEREERARAPAETSVILLGDLVDRGPHASGVLEAARDWGRRRIVRFLSGNHEELFLLSFHKPGALRNFLRFGGRETLQSYGLDPDEIERMPFQQAQIALSGAVPRQDREFMNAFEPMIAIGDYVFVHAGVNPHVSLASQSLQDLRWIREPFLSHKGDLGAVIVHGHTVTNQVVVRPNRIGIDTGAYQSGRLTALCLEGVGRSLIQTEQDSHRTITTHVRSIDDVALDETVPGSL